MYLKAWTCGHAGSLVDTVLAGSVVDLLDVADVHVVQHITALSQNPGEGFDDIQHRNLLSIF